VEQLGGLDVADRAAGAVAEGLGVETFPYADCPGEDPVLLLADPVEVEQLSDPGTVVADVADRGAPCDGLWGPPNRSRRRRVAAGGSGWCGGRSISS
jgi:hypothetical protein